MIEMRVRQEDKIDPRQMLDLQPRALDPFEQKQPICEIRIYQDIEVVELDQE